MISKYDIMGKLKTVKLSPAQLMDWIEESDPALVHKNHVALSICTDAMPCLDK